MQNIKKTVILFAIIFLNFFSPNYFSSNNTLYKEHIAQLVDIADSNNSAILAIMNFKKTFLVFAKDFDSNNENSENSLYYYFLNNDSGSFEKHHINIKIESNDIVKIINTQNNIAIYLFNSRDSFYYKFSSEDAINWKYSLIS